MTVKQLITLLAKLPDDLPVFIGYDSMAVVKEIENDKHNFVLTSGEDRGVYLCAQSASACWMITPESKSCYIGGVLLKDYKQ